MNCKLGSILQIHKRLNQEGYFVSEYALRKWVKDGVIPTVSTGNKNLLSYDKVLEFLNTGKVVTGA